LRVVPTGDQVQLVPEAVACLAGNVPEERRAVDPANPLKLLLTRW
jgi:hypothetical protein